MTSIIETRNVSYSYGERIAALKDVSISLDEGRKIALVGPNGAGKSTLMSMFNGILRPNAGEILFHGMPLRYDSASLREIRRKVGMVFQNSDDQIFAPTVYQDVAFGPVNLGLPVDQVKKRVDYALQYVGLSGYERRPPHHLSGGEKKRVAIAGILAMEPEVIILDEPTSNLDPASSEEIMDMLDELNYSGKTIIISTHDVEMAYRWADEVVLMEKGGLLRRGTVQEVFGDVELIRRARLKLPIVVDLYKELIGRGLLNDNGNGTNPPKSILELTDLVESRNRETISRVAGATIHICDVDNASPEDITKILENSNASYTGAMGTKAKILAEQAKIPLDFTYGVIDKCILKSLMGKPSLIMTAGGMVDHSVKRIQAYCDESGAKIDVAVKPSLGKSGRSSDRKEIMRQEDSTKPTEAAQ
ncbi:MAG: energy-coupling factor ABC transporter ATP-binding protein [Methanotrichaceae archaeon]